MSPASRWLAYLSSANISAHERWVNAGCQGLGRIVLEGLTLREATLAAPNLIAAKFIRCDLTDSLIRFGDLTKTELVECTWDNALLERSRFDKALVQDCRFIGANLKIAKFIGVSVQGGNWSKANIERTDWANAQVVKVSFRAANFQEARLNKAAFISCDCREATIADMTPYDAVFEHCDFRNTDVNGLKLKNTVFYKCGFYGCTGTPTMEGACEVIEPDLSEAFDGSGVVDAAHLFQRWGLSTNA